MLRQALGFWFVSLLMFAPTAYAQDAEFDESGTEESAEVEEVIELQGVDDYVRESWYIQIAFAHAAERKLEDAITNNLDRAVAPPPSLFLPDPNSVNTGRPYGAPGQLISIGPVDVSSSNGVDIRAGRRLAANLAVEAQFEYQKFDTEIGNWGDISTDTYAFTINLKVPVLTGRVQPYALLGGGFMYANPDSPFPVEDILASRNSSDITKYKEIVNARNFGSLFRLGGGVDIYLNHNVYVTTEATWVTSQGNDVDDIKYLSFALGLGYRF